MRRTSSLDPIDDAVLARATTPAEAGYPVIAATSSRYAVAWKETATDETKALRFAEFDHEGKKICGPVDLRKSFTSDNPEFTPVDMAIGDIGYVMLSISPVGVSSPTFEIAVVRPGCQFVERFVLEIGFAVSYGASIVSAGNRGFAIMYTTEGDPKTTYAGMFGPHFCD